MWANEQSRFDLQQCYKAIPARQRFYGLISDPRVLLYDRWRRTFSPRTKRSICETHTHTHTHTVFRLPVTSSVCPFLHSPSWCTKRHAFSFAIYLLFLALSPNSRLMGFNSVSTGILLSMFRKSVVPPSSWLNNSKNRPEISHKQSDFTE